MFGLIKRAPKKIALSALKPRRSIAALKYVAGRDLAVSDQRHNEALQSALAPKDVQFRHISFTFAIISLSAKLATLEGKLTRESYLAFRDAFPLSGGLCSKLRKLFVLACNDPTPMEHYIQQVKHAFPRNKPLFQALASRLFAVASATGAIGRKQEHFLAKAARMLELSASEYSALYEAYSSTKPHHVLGTEKRPTKAHLKKRYYQLMHRYHPDRYASEAVSPELAQLLSLRTSEISAAYKALSKKAA